MTHLRTHFALVALLSLMISGCEKSGVGPDRYASTPPHSSLVPRSESNMPLADSSADKAASEGQGPGQGGDKYDLIVENSFLAPRQNPVSTFSIDVDTASYSKARMYLLDHKQLPPPDAVRIEELVNYFDYDYENPTGEHPFAADIEIAQCPWKPEHRLVRVGIKGREMPPQQRPISNLVFLIDVSGSMSQPNKLPLLQRSMKMLVDQLGENDRVAIVVYAGAAGLVLPSTAGDDKQAIIDALDKLRRRWFDQRGTRHSTRLSGSARQLHSWRYESRHTLHRW